MGAVQRQWRCEPVAGQVRELRAALSVNKSELAKILRVSRPTVYAWLDGKKPYGLFA